MTDFSDFFAECDRAPRLNQLTSFFASTAAGQNGMPTRNPAPDIRLLPNERLLHQYITLHEGRQGHFDKHYHCSIPYRLEEEYRMALALLKYAENRANPLLLYSLGTAEGTMARALSELSDGKIRSLCCSPNVENQSCFLAYGDPNHSDFFLGPFHRLTKEHLCTSSKFPETADGFDVVFEDTTFQMYSANRPKQIEFACHHLKDDGILILLEKFRDRDPTEFARREWQKDFGFKSRYFPASDIQTKGETVLSIMHENQVTLEEAMAALRLHLRYAAVTWNSGNFYALAASNSQDNLKGYLAAISPAAIPSEYLYISGSPHFLKL
jgi:hypothetical protein